MAAQNLVTSTEVTQTVASIAEPDATVVSETEARVQAEAERKM